MSGLASHAKRAVLWIGIALSSSATYAWNVGLWPRTFDIAWNEEVQLHDGRVIVVSIKRTYQRKGMRLEQYPKYPYRMSMEFSFDTGFPMGRFTHTFKRGNLVFLDQKDDKWYIGYYADEGDISAELGAKHLYPHVAILGSDGAITKPKSWDEVPTAITRMNIMPSTPDEKAISKFHGRLLTLQSKMQHWAAYPTGAGEHTIPRLNTESAIGDQK